MDTRKRADGTAVIPNIQRQPWVPNHEVRMNASVAPTGRWRTRHQLMNWATRIPTTIVSWLIETSLPRDWAGAISEMYIGARLEARPIATPPSIRHSMKALKDWARALPMEVTAKRSAERMRSRFLPKRSLRPPAATAPTRQPIRAQLFAQPTRCGSCSWKKLSKNGFAPPMTTQSQPKRSPPSATTVAIMPTYVESMASEAGAGGEGLAVFMGLGLRGRRLGAVSGLRLG